MSFKEQFTTVTPLSKGLAMVVFVILPFAAFFLGVNYGQQSLPPTQTIVSSVADDIINVPDEWVAYENEEYGFRFIHPEEWELDITERKEKWTEKVIPGVIVLLYDDSFQQPASQGTSIGFSVSGSNEIGVQTIEFLSSGSLSEVSNVERKNIQGAEGIQFIWQSEVLPEASLYPNPSLRTVFDTENYRYYFTYDYPYGGTTDNFIEQYNQMVSSFELI